MEETLTFRLHEAKATPEILQRSRQVLFATGSLALGLGLLKTAGLVFRLSTIVAPSPALSGMVLTTALCFSLAGLGLLASLSANDREAARIQKWLGGLIFLIAAVSVIEIVTDRNLGPDFASLHARLMPSYAPAGRMAPNTAISFLMTGFALAFWSSARSRAVVRVLSPAIFFLGASGTVGYFLKFQYFYTWYSSVGLLRMALPTGLGLMLVASGLWSMSAHVPLDKRAREADGHELRGIFNASAIVLLLTASATAITAFALVQHRLIALASDHITQLAHYDRDILEQVLDQRGERALSIAREESFAQVVLAWSRDPNSALAAGRLQQAAGALLGQGFSGFLFRSADGPVLQIGTIVPLSAVRAAVHTGPPGELIWSRGYYLASSNTLLDSSGHAIVEMLTQQRLTTIDRLAAEPATWSRTGSLVLCTVQPQGASCFPDRMRPEPFTIRLSAASGSGPAQPHSGSAPVPDLPMDHALAGETGTRVALDYRDVPVTASYLPVRNASLGLVLKVDSTEIYEPVRHCFEITLPLAVLLILGSLAVMQLQLRPLVDRLVRSREDIRLLAMIDPLTGLANRFLMQDRLQLALANARRSETSVALAMIDVDLFKEVNDTYGHHAGDMLLKTIADRLTGCTRSTDTVARMGGDEFVLILPDIRFPEATLLVARKIHAAFAAPVQVGSAALAIRLSIGIAVFPSAGIDEQTLLRNADSAMYAAKAKGGDSIHIYTPSADERSFSNLPFGVAARREDTLPGMTLSPGHV